MRVFEVGLTGDFLDVEGRSAYGDIGFGLLAAAPHVRCRFLAAHAPHRGDASYWERLYSMEVTAEDIAGLNGLMVLRPRVGIAAFARGAADLTVIGRSGAGYDKIDLAACTENDVALFNAPLALNHSTASTALLFLLALAKRLPEQQKLVREGRWDLQASVTGSELQGRTLGIVGLGHSGRELARLVAPLAMSVIAFSPHAEAQQAAALGVRLTSLETLLREADFVSLHCRLTPATRRLIGERELGWMKPTAHLVNVARGEVIDQPALVAALRQRRIAGAALDVFEVEPLPVDDPLLELPNVILTPHWNASTSDIWRATGEAMAAGMLRAARGEAPENVVNTEVLARPGFREKLGRFAENR